MEFAHVYNIKLNKGIRTPFHKKYTVHDGLGLLYFDTLVEARMYVRNKANQLEHLFKESKQIYKTISGYYIDKLLVYREFDYNFINGLLKDILDHYKYLSRNIFPQYSLPNIKQIYTCFLQVAKRLKMQLLYKRIEVLYSSFFTPYPAYRSADYSAKNQDIIKEDINIKLKKYA